jgi:hypothetical protein
VDEGIRTEDGQYYQNEHNSKSRNTSVISLRLKAGPNSWHRSLSRLHGRITRTENWAGILLQEDERAYDEKADMEQQVHMGN